jgi:hypothetical protein
MASPFHHYILQREGSEQLCNPLFISNNINTDVMQLATYSKEQKNGTYTFHVTPARTPKMWFLIILGVIMATFVVASIYALLVGALIIWAGTLDYRPKIHKQTSTFSVSTSGITSNGRLFPLEDIHELRIRNSMYDETMLVTYSTSHGQQQGMLYKEMISRLSYSLNIQAGGKSHVIAGGMDKDTADGLWTEVTRIISVG